MAKMNMLKEMIVAVSDKIILRGHVENVYKYFKYGDVFVLSSKWEEVGFVIVKQIIKPIVISSDCPNGPSEFLNHGKNGILFKNNQRALCAALENFVSLSEKRI